MPFKFQWLCELLEELQSKRHHRVTTAARSQNPDHQILLSWFNKYDHKIERTGRSAIAFLSSIFPERRVDRVYNLQEKRLSPLFGRALGLGSSRTAELNKWRERDGDDFPTCVERVMRQCEFDTPPAGREVTLEEIDAALHQLAANSPFSSPAVKACANDTSAENLLRPILQRLQSSEAKWLLHMMFKSLGTIQIPEDLAMKQFHFMLPDLLTIQNSFEAATKVLGKSTISVLPPRPDIQFEKALRPFVAREIIPELGTMIRRQPYHKARSIKHCCTIVNKRQMSIERKYDGEYCQIHIDISQGRECVQIFSKSGKDSTNDRLRLHGPIKNSLRLDLDGCKIRTRCIIEGELLVWSSFRKEILPFHKIRKHVKHGGRYIGTAQDSPVKPDEELMIVYYDLLMLDDILLLNESHTIRRRHLKGLVRSIEGKAIVGERTIIDFNSRRASTKLRETFAHSITQRWEGLVLKACDEPFFSFSSNNHGIKLKKDYITGLGDSADLCLVGGRRDARVEQGIGLGQLRWTSFHVGCLVNKEQVVRFGAKPCIRIVDELTNHSMPDAQFLDLNQLGRLLETPFQISIEEYDVEMGNKFQKLPTELFRQPFVVEIMGAGFERLPNSSFYTLRFPRKIDGKVKLHTDRSVVDSVSFKELQEMAKQNMQAPETPDSQEDVEWVEKLISADGKARNTQDTSQSTTSVHTPKSAATISISPVQRRSKKTAPPIYIRADTEDRDTPEEESCPTPKFQSQQSKFARSSSQQRIAVQRAVEMSPESDLPETSVPTPTPNATTASLPEDYFPPSNGHQNACQGSGETLDRSNIMQANNKRRCLANSTVDATPDNESQNKPPIVIDLMSPARKVYFTRNPLSTININPAVPPVMNNTTSLAPLAYYVSSSGQESLPSHVRTADNNSNTTSRIVQAYKIQQSALNSQFSDRGQNQPSANISRKRTKHNSYGMQKNTVQQLAMRNQEATETILTPPPSSSLQPNTDQDTAVLSHSTDEAKAHEQGFPAPAGSGQLQRNETDKTKMMVEPLAPVSTPMNATYKVAEPILITNSLYDYDLKAKSQVDLQTMLKASRKSHTSSVSIFLDHVDSSISSANSDHKSLHIILINFKDVQGAKQDLEEIFGLLIFCSRRVPNPSSETTRDERDWLKAYSNTILVFDYRVLTKCGEQGLTMDVLRSLRDTDDGPAVFGGVVKIDKKRLESGREPKFLLLTDWSWAGKGA